MDDVCAVCVDALGPTAVALPGCGHRFHVACALTCAQYDVRCPVCRRCPDGVRPRAKEEEEEEGARLPTVVIEWEDEEDTAAAEVRRTRRILRRHPDLQRLDAARADLRAQRAALQARTQREVHRRVRHLWRADPRALEQRETLDRLRRRELRLERRLDAALLELTGGILPT